MTSASLWVYMPPVDKRSYGRPIIVVTNGAEYAIGRLVTGGANSTFGILWDSRSIGGTVQRALVGHARQMDKLGYTMSMEPTDLALTDAEVAEMGEGVKPKALLTERVLTAMGAIHG